jgi:PAS domain S-box-containing protein
MGTCNDQPSKDKSHNTTTISRDIAENEQFRRLVESVTDYAIFVLDTHGNIMTWNPAAERIKGYTASEIIGKHFSTFYTAADIARHHPEHELVVALREGRYEEEGVRVRKDGSEFIANVVITPIYDASGAHVGFAKVTRDITERRRVEEARLQSMRDQISRAFLKEILFSVTEGRLRYCDSLAELPPKLPNQSAIIDFDRKSLAGVRQAVRQVLEPLEFPSDRGLDLLTAVGEASMNAVVHATSATAQICTNSDATVQVWISDHGKGIELTQLHRATLERGFTTQGTLGHGFWLMLRTCDRIWLFSSSDGTTVVLEQERHEPDPSWLTQANSQAALE